jgi:hypothetical protein
VGLSVRSGLAGRSAGKLDSVGGVLTGIRAGCSLSFTSGLAGTSSVRGIRSIRAGRSLELGTRFPSRLPSLPSRPGSTSRTGRAGRATAPVGRASTDPFEPPLGPGTSCRASRPLKIRERRSSSSRRTPGFRVVAPVGLSVSSLGGATLAGRATVIRSLLSPAIRRSPAAYAGLTGKSVRNGSALTTRRASVSSAGLVLPSPPKSFAGIVDTARYCAGFTRCKRAISSARSGRNRSSCAW